MYTQLLSIETKNAQKAYNKGSKEIKEALVDLFPKHNFDLKLIDRIETYADACHELGINPLTISDFTFLPEKDQDSNYAYHQLTIIARVLNESWEPDYSDENQYKYYPYFIWDNESAGGSGFSFDGCRLRPLGLGRRCPPGF